MTVVPPRLPPRDSGDAWVEGPDGRRFWGRYGAAGLLVHDPAAGVLLQHRAEWSHHGGTWGLPGGARHEGESAIDGAIREAAEEAGVPAAALELAFTSTLDLGYWSYVTVVTRAVTPFTPQIGDAESLELRWVPIAEVEALPLHPGFGTSWPALRARLGERMRVVVDAANVVGSRPDGWWRDRVGANERLLARVTSVAAQGIPAVELAEAGESAPAPGPEVRGWPVVTVVLEGEAKRAGESAPQVTGGSRILPPTAVEIVLSPGSGDDTIVQVAAAAAASGENVIVVTADRALRDRVTAHGAVIRGPGWLLSLADAAEAADAASPAPADHRPARSGAADADAAAAAGGDTEHGGHRAP
jgi:8-oxo-dGTP diphosphatase